MQPFLRNDDNNRITDIMIHNSVAKVLLNSVCVDSIISNYLIMPKHLTKMFMFVQPNDIEM